MNDEQRVRFEPFRSATCRLQPTQPVDVMKRATPDETVQSGAGIVSSFATNLFLADFVETTCRLGQGTEPPTPDLVLIAYAEMGAGGEIPGKGPGVMRDGIL